MKQTYEIPEIEDVEIALGLKPVERGDSFSTPTIRHRGLSIDIKQGGRCRYKYTQVYVNIETGQYTATRRKVMLFKTTGAGISWQYDKMVRRPLTADEKKNLKAKVKEMAEIQKAYDNRLKASQKAQKDSRKRNEVIEKAFDDSDISTYNEPRIDTYRERISVSFKGKTPEEAIALYRKIEELVEAEE